MIPRKRLSGAQYRKQAEERAKKTKQSAEALNRWLINSSSEAEDAVIDCQELDQEDAEPKQEEHQKSDGEKSIRLQEPCSSISDCTYQEESSNTAGATSTVEECTNTNIESNVLDRDIDPFEHKTWPTHDKLKDNVRCFLSTETLKVLDDLPTTIDFQSTLREGRHLTVSAWYKNLENNEKIKRTWLTYSRSDNALFCIPCKLFKSGSEYTNPGMSSLQTDGLKNWKKVLERLCAHESSKHHKESFVKWRTLIHTINSKEKGISAQLEQAIECEKNKWREILKIIIDVILYLACNCLSFRGTLESTIQSNINTTMAFTRKEQGNFLNLIYLLARHNPILKSVLEGRQKGQISYLSKTIQNEVINMMGGCVRKRIIDEIVKAKYYTVMFDCTPDVAHKEQMSQVIRYVTTERGTYVVKESFIDFIEVHGKTGEYLAETIINKLTNDGLDITNCRGQSYDNGSNMAGAYKGVQARFKEVNPKAAFVPCIAHSLNLIGLHASSISAEVSNVFGVVQRLYNFFVSSPHRWEIMKRHCKSNLKGTSQTRWSAKSEAVNAIIKNFDGVKGALEEITNGQCQNPETKSEASSLQKSILDFRFILYLVAWNELLKEINRVSKQIQKNDIILSKSVDMLEGLSKTMQRLRDEKTQWFETAKDIAERFGIPTNLTSHRIPKKKRLPGEDQEDESRKMSHEEIFSKSINEVIDTILTQLRDRMENTKHLNTSFRFLSGQGLEELSNDELQTQATNLAVIYDKDLSQEEFPTEVVVFRDHLANTKYSDFNAIDLLNFVEKRGLADAFPNVMVALRIFSTFPTTSAECERSFSKLKIIKNYLRNSMAEDRLSDLAILSIESELAGSIDYDSAIDLFAEKKSRRVAL